VRSSPEFAAPTVSRQRELVEEGHFECADCLPLAPRPVERPALLRPRNSLSPKTHSQCRTNDARCRAHAAIGGRALVLSGSYSTMHRARSGLFHSWSPKPLPGASWLG